MKFCDYLIDYRAIMSEIDSVLSSVNPSQVERFVNLVSKYRDKIINSISKLTTLNKDQINLKGKTVEKLGIIGKEKAIACEVIVSITKHD